MKPLIAPEEAARRVRAAIAYAGIKQPELVARTSLTIATVRRIVSDTNPRGATIEDLWQIADACSVPRSFMEHGYAMLEEDSESSEARVEDLASRLAAVERRLDVATPPAGGAIPQPPGELGRRATGAQPTSAPQRQGDSQAAAAREPGSER